MPIHARSTLARLAPLATTIGVAAAVTAAQLGVAYGLAILMWTRDFGDSSGAGWAANLTWVCWLVASSAVLGTIVGARVTGAAPMAESPLTKAATAAAAGVGTLVSLPLVAIPARYAEIAGDPSPAFTVTRMAIVGVLLGAIVSFGVLLGRPLAWNVIANTSWLWLVALGSVLASLGGEDGAPGSASPQANGPAAVRLALWGAGPPTWLTTLLPMLLTALAIGVAVAYVAKHLEHSRVSVAVSGAAGPLLVGVAYLVAGPGARPETSEQFLPYLAAPYAVVAGLLGSLLVVAIERPEISGTATSHTARSTGAVAAFPTLAAQVAHEPATSSGSMDNSYSLGEPGWVDAPDHVDKPGPFVRSATETLEFRVDRLALEAEQREQVDARQPDLAWDAPAESEARQPDHAWGEPEERTEAEQLDQGRVDADADTGEHDLKKSRGGGWSATRFFTPAPPPDPIADSGTELSEPELAPQERGEWADDEQWLEQIRANERNRHTLDPTRHTPESPRRPSPSPSAKSSTPRRRWTLFDEED